MNTFWSFWQQAIYKMVWVLMPLLILISILMYIPGLEVFEQMFIAFIFIVIEIYVIWKQVVPFISEGFTNLFLNGGGPVDEDAIIEAAKLLMSKERWNDASQLLRQYTDDNASQLRAWILRTDFLCHDMGRYDEAVECLKEGLHKRKWGPQDKAFFLYRIGKIYADHLDNRQKALDYWNEAASKYPRTAYGKEALKRLS